MSIPVALEDLEAAVAEHDFAYLITLGDQEHAHVVTVQPRVTASGVVVGNLGRRTVANAVARPAVTVVWPPRQVGGYSLIVDGTSKTDAVANSVTVRVGRAVLHRPGSLASGAVAGDDVEADGCGNDCVELPASNGLRG